MAMADDPVLEIRRLLADMLAPVPDAVTAAAVTAEGVELEEPPLAPCVLL